MDADENAAFIAGSGKAPAVEAAEPAKVVVRFDAALLARVDRAAKRQGITRTAWLHRAAFDAHVEKPSLSNEHAAATAYELA